MKCGCPLVKSIGYPCLGVVKHRVFFKELSLGYSTAFECGWMFPKFAEKICRKTPKIWVKTYAKTLVSGEDFFPSADPLKVRQEAMIMYKKWSSMPAIQLNIYIFARMSEMNHAWRIIFDIWFGWVELPVATRELQTHLCQKHSMYCCWVERPPITFGKKNRVMSQNLLWMVAQTCTSWLVANIHLFWVGFNHPNGAGFLLLSTVSNSIFGVIHEISIKGFRNHPQNHIITIYFWCYPLKKYPLNIPSGKLTVCYWKWPSRNSEFSH